MYSVCEHTRWLSVNNATIIDSRTSSGFTYTEKTLCIWNSEPGMATNGVKHTAFN